MKKIMFGALAAWLAFVMVSCGGGSGDSADARPFSPPFGPGNRVSSIVGLIGLVVDSTNGTPVSGVTVTAGALSTTTDTQGNFALPTIANGSNVVSFTLNTYAPQSRTVQISSTIETSLIVQMVPNGALDPFDPATGGTLTVAGSTGQIDIPGNSLRRADGSVPSAGSASALLTPIGPSLDPFLLPGEYVVQPAAGGSTAQFETFGGLDIRITDAGGTALTNLVAPATIRIPVNSRNTTIPPTVSLMRFDSATGLWVEEGTATLQGVAPNQYYEGTVTRIATWTAGQIYTASIITACVQDQAGAPVGGARVNSDGINYSGGGTATTNASGIALVPMKRGGQAVITATSPRSSNSASVGAGQSAADFTLAPCLIMPTAGMTIRLTWGASPTDLDSHLKGPNGTHVFFASTGSLSVAPFAALDVDDTTGFGPEVISIARLTQGTNEYFVRNFPPSTFTPGQTGSPARVEVRVGSQIRIFFPGTGEALNEYWRVFQFIVDANCAVTINPLVNSWSATEPADPSGGATGTVCN